MPLRQGVPRESLVSYGPQEEIFQEIQQKRKKVQLMPLDSKLSIEDILNAIIPPQQWRQTGKMYARHVSNTPSSREEVSNLKKLLDDRLTARQARENGICPIREELHNQCFDELIREVAIDCPERGMLLVRVRDQLKMTISAYQTLYNSSVTFGMRKQMQSELGTPQLQEDINALSAKKTLLKDKLIELGKKREFIEKQIKERRMGEQKKRSEQLQFLKYQLNNYQSFIKQANQLNK